MVVTAFALAGAGPSMGQGLHYISDDIVVLEGAQAISPRPISDFMDEDCKAKIKDSVCVVEPGGSAERECLPESVNYVPLFERIHDRIPVALQKMFCRVSRIFVEKELKSTAYASPWSLAIGIRKSLLDEKLTFAHWASWKEQLTFGGKLDSYHTDENLPTFVSNGTHEDFVTNVMIHEFGHLFDFANDLNQTSGAEMKSGTWGALSWKNLMMPLAQFDFSDRVGVCFYDCEDHPLPKQKVQKVYEDLYAQTNFLNTYTSRNAREDFADTFAFHFSFDLDPALSYVLETRQGKTFDFKAEMASSRLSKKVSYIEAFVNQSDLLYP